MTNEARVEAVLGLPSGKYSVLTNCQLLPEGFDEPKIDWFIIGRPTQSSALFTKMVAKRTGIFPLKKDCLVLNFTDIATSLIGLDGSME